MDEIIAQVRASCPCTSDLTDEELGSYLTILNTIISKATCWDDGGCSTLLRNERTENIFIPKGSLCQCGCDKGIMRIPLRYTNVDSVTINAQVIKDNGMSEEYIEVPVNRIFYSTLTNEIRIDLNSIFDNCNCDCSSAYLQVTFDAGYDLYPDCVLPIICELLTVLILTKVGCTLEDCCDYTKPQRDYVLTSKKLGEITYSYTKDSEGLYNIYKEYLLRNKLSVLTNISICVAGNNIWAVKGE